MIFGGIDSTTVQGITAFAAGVVGLATAYVRHRDSQKVALPSQGMGEISASDFAAMRDDFYRFRRDADDRLSQVGHRLDEGDGRISRLAERTRDLEDRADRVERSARRNTDAIQQRVEIGNERRPGDPDSRQDEDEG